MKIIDKFFCDFAEEVKVQEAKKSIKDEDYDRFFHNWANPIEVESVNWIREGF